MGIIGESTVRKDILVPGYRFYAGSPDSIARETLEYVSPKEFMRLLEAHINWKSAEQESNIA